MLFGIGLYFYLNYYVYNDLQKTLKQNAEGISSRIQQSLYLSLKGFPIIDLELETRDLNSTNTFLQLYNLQLKSLKKSAVLEAYGFNLPINKETIEKLKATEYFFVKTKVGGQDLLVYHTGVYGADENGNKQLLGVLQAAYPVGTFEKFFGALQYMLAFLALLTILLAASLGWFLARKALKPIDKVIAAANLIEKGDDLERRIEYNGPDDEIGRLTNTINGMLARIQVIYSELNEAYRAQRRFVSDASHELRTPLTTIRGNVELLEKMWNQPNGSVQLANPEQMEMSLEAMQDISGEAQRMSRLVNNLLALARADAGFQMQKSAVELRPLVEEVVRRAHFLPRKADWEVGELSGLEGTLVQGNRDYIQQLIFIFIENAFKYTPQGVVKLDTLRSDTQVGIRIMDTGIGMDKEEIPMIFDRFYRADPSRGVISGTGLGLSIAKWIIDEHMGSIEVTTSKGKGSTFVIWFPASFPPSLQ
jgi:two-component system OmpR family sensor kinase